MVTSDFLKTGHQLKKKDEQLKAVRERVSFWKKREIPGGGCCTYDIEGTVSAR